MKTFSTNNSNWLLPFVFIILYGSGFVATKYGLVNASPLAFLLIRFFIAFILLILLSYFLKVAWPKSMKEVFHIAVAGSLTVAVFSIGVYISINEGVSPSLNALIIALQPALVSILAIKFLGEEISLRHWIGLLIGFVGVCFVVISKFELNSPEMFGILMTVFALLGLSFGNLYQKKYCSHMNLFSGGVIQTCASFVVVLPLMLAFEDIRVDWNMDLVYAILYMSVAVSIGALSVLYILIKKGDVSKVSSMFYLIHVCAAVMSYVFFDESIEMGVVLGIITVLIGISLINKKDKKEGKDIK